MKHFAYTAPIVTSCCLTVQLAACAGAAGEADAKPSAAPVTTAAAQGTAPVTATPGTAPVTTAAAPDPHSPARPGWTLTFSDEFEGPSGAPVDPAKWNLTNQGDGFGNNELEFYTNRTDNVALDGQGSLVITAKRETFSQHDYTSARLDTYRKFQQQYGRFEARIKLPRGQGLWPAFWMLGSNVLDVSWPDCGEVDIMQNIGSQPSTIYGTLDGPGYSGDHTLETAYTLTNNQLFADDFHLFAVEWEENVVRFYVDEQLYATHTSTDVPQGARWVYDHPFYLLLNVAIGGDLPGPPDATTQFPQSMWVDYVRAYTKSAAAAP